MSLDPHCNVVSGKSLPMLEEQITHYHKDGLAANQLAQAIFQTLLQSGEHPGVICYDGKPHSLVSSSHQQSQGSMFN